jgi:putative transposase
MKFAWVRDHASEFTVKRMCQLLHVSRSGFYAWRDRTPSARQVRHQTLVVQVRSAHTESRRTYGSPRVAAELKTRGVKICVNTAARLMREEGLKARKRRRFVPRTSNSRHDYPIAPNRLDRRFAAGSDRDAAAAAPNRVWASDLTYLPTQQGWLYLWVVLDLFSRKVVGWSMTDHQRAEGAVDALMMAIRQRRPEADLLHHSDRGVQYACGDYREVLADHEMIASMSRTGNCYDNAVAESFFKTLKTEWVDAGGEPTAEQARSSLFEWIEVFYNRQRRHSSLNFLSPEAFEAQMT